MKYLFTLVVTFAFTAPAFAQPPDVERYVREHQPAIVREFMELVAIPNVRSDLPNIKRNAELLRQMLERRGMKPEIWDTPSTPLVYGERHDAELGELAVEPQSGDDASGIRRDVDAGAYFA